MPCPASCQSLPSISSFFMSCHPHPSSFHWGWEGTLDITAQLCVGTSNWALEWSRHHNYHLFLSSPYPGPLRAHLSLSPLLSRQCWSKYRGQPARPAICSGLQHCFPQRGFHVPHAARAGGLSGPSSPIHSPPLLPKDQALGSRSLGS